MQSRRVFGRYIPFYLVFLPLALYRGGLVRSGGGVLTVAECFRRLLKTLLGG